MSSLHTTIAGVPKVTQQTVITQTHQLHRLGNKDTNPTAIALAAYLRLETGKSTAMTPLPGVLVRCARVIQRGSVNAAWWRCCLLGVNAATCVDTASLCSSADIC